MARDRLQWTSDGLRAELVPVDPLPWLKPGVLGVLLALLALIGIALASQEVPDLVTPEGLSEACLEAPWDCPMTFNGSPGEPYDEGIRPDEVAYLVDQIARGQTNFSGMCVDLFRGRVSGMGQTNTDCVKRLASDLRQGALTVPPSGPQITGFPAGKAKEFEKIWASHLRGTFRARHDDWVKRETRMAVFEHGRNVARVEASSSGGLVMAGLIALVLMGLFLYRRQGLRPVVVELTAAGVRVGHVVFPRSHVASADVGERLRLRFVNGEIWESPQLLLHDHEELRAALGSLLLSDEELIAEQHARKEAVIALQAAKPREVE